MEVRTLSSICYLLYELHIGRFCKSVAKAVQKVDQKDPQMEPNDDQMPPKSPSKKHPKNRRPKGAKSGLHSSVQHPSSIGPKMACCIPGISFVPQSRFLVPMSASGADFVIKC